MKKLIILSAITLIATCTYCQELFPLSFGSSIKDLYSLVLEDENIYITDDSSNKMKEVMYGETKYYLSFGENGLKAVGLKVNSNYLFSWVNRSYNAAITKEHDGRFQRWLSPMTPHYCYEFSSDYKILMEYPPGKIQF